VLEAEKLQKFRTLVSAGYLKKQATFSPPASPPADSKASPAAMGAEKAPVYKGVLEPSYNRISLDEKQVAQPRVKEASSNGLDVQRKPSKQLPGRSEVRDRRHRSVRSTAAKRGDRVLLGSGK